MNEPVPERVAELYDAGMWDWPGEVEFYRALAAEERVRNQGVLEVGCGTGRIALRLAEDGARVVGLDLSRAMLDQGRKKSTSGMNLRWVEGDIRQFDLGERFGLVIAPGHVFQALLTPEEQRECLGCLRRHLVPEGRIVLHLDHQDFEWLGGLCGDKGGVFDHAREFVHPRTGNRMRTSRAWTYARATQIATAVIAYEELAPDGSVMERWEHGPLEFHCAFRFEIDHLLALTGFQVEALYGGFLHEPLTDQSTEMVWVARANPTVA